MPDCPRRTLLSGLSSTVAVAAAGCLSITDDIDKTPADEVERHESPGWLEPGELDADEKYIEIEVRKGDPTPVDELVLKLDGEPYDAEIWADGRDEIEAGATILVATEDAEPNLRITLHHETEYGMPAQTTLYGDFEFAFDYDSDARTVSIRYEDEFPLDGDHVILALYDATDYRLEPEPLRTTRPWIGSDLSSGDEATLENVDPGTAVHACWKRPSRHESLADART